LKENISAKEEFTQVIPAESTKEKPLGLSAKRVERKPLGQGRIHQSESLSRVRMKTSRPFDQESSKENLSVKEEFTQVNPCREYGRKPLGQGRIHPSESLPRVRKENISAKEEFTQVNPCREYGRNLSASRPR